MKQRKRCPVCKVDRTYAGPICPKCTELGYRIGNDGKPHRKLKKGKNQSLDDFLSTKGHELIPKTVRASREVWEGVQVVADLKGVSVNALVNAVLEKTLEENL